MLKVDKIQARYLHVRGYLSIFAVYICVYIVGNNILLYNRLQFFLFIQSKTVHSRTEETSGSCLRFSLFCPLQDDAELPL